MNKCWTNLQQVSVTTIETALQLLATAIYYQHLNGTNHSLDIDHIITVAFIALNSTTCLGTSHLTTNG